MDFPGGIAKIEIADADDFDTSGNATFLVTAGRATIAEGTEFPDPESVTAALADDRELNQGKNQEIAIRLTSLGTGDFDQLESAEQGPTEVFVRASSMRTTDAGAPVFEVTYKKVILSHVAHGPVNADRESYGTIQIDGMATGASTSDVYSITMN
jgi:hypothetical protein